MKGFTTTHTQERKRPDQPIAEAELQKLIDGVQREALREAERAIRGDGLLHVDVRLVHAAVTGAAIDGYALTNPVGFQGRHVKIGIFNALCRWSTSGRSRAWRASSTSKLLEIVAEPYAVARVLGSDHLRQAGALLFIDVGGGTTGRRARALGRDRGHADVCAWRTRCSRSRSRTGSTCPFRVPSRSRWITRVACRGPA